MHAPGSPEDFERALGGALYRFDCPDAHTLGEYQIGVLDAPETMRVARHASECDECQAELRLLRGFLAAEVEIPETPVERVRRMVATLFRPAPGLALSGVRGAAAETTQVYQAGDVTITLSGSLLGLIVGPGLDLEGRAVRLIPRAGATIGTTIDDLGNFEVEDAAPGVYALEIELPDGVIVIEELQLG